MKLSEFILLDEHAKKQTVLNHGLLLAKRKNQENMVFLFQLDNYYVETCFNRENKSIVSFLVFKNDNALEPYLGAIRIDDLLN
jgi:hypothetical protein